SHARPLPSLPTRRSSDLAALFAAAPPAKVPDQWVKLIDQLGDDDTREAAAKKLTALGEDVLPALRRAAKEHDDPDVRLRAVVLRSEEHTSELQSLTNLAC